MLPLYSVSDRVIVVTGGLGQLGRQFSLSLLQNDARVAILDPAVDDGCFPSEWDRFLDSGQLFGVSADVTSRESLEDALKKVRSQWDCEPSGLINNAALDSPPEAPENETGPFEDFPEASWDRVMDVNVKGVYLSCQVFGQAMSKAGFGSIINIGSTYGLVSPDHRIYSYRQEKGGAPFFKPVVYSASKSALVNLTRYLAVYWARSGVRVNLLSLGGVFNHQNKNFIEAYCERTPLGRMANENEYNGAIVFLLSNASSYMTGSNMIIDGGWTAW